MRLASEVINREQVDFLRHVISENPVGLELKGPRGEVVGVFLTKESYQLMSCLARLSSDPKYIANVLDKHFKFQGENLEVTSLSQLEESQETF